MVSYNRFIAGSRDSGFFDEEAMDFQERILLKSGLSEETFFPPGAAAGAPRACCCLLLSAAGLLPMVWLLQPIGLAAGSSHQVLACVQPVVGCPLLALPAAARTNPAPPPLLQACTWTLPSLT